MRSILFITRVDRAYFVLKLLSYIRTKTEKIDLVIVSDDRYNPCKIMVDNFEYMSPNVNQEEFIKGIIKKYNVKGVFVASSYDLLLLKNIKLWLLEQEISYYTPDENSLKICLSKYRQYYFLTEIGVLTPCVYDYEDILHNNQRDIFPVIVKPIYGQGSEEVVLVSNKEELKKKAYNEDFLIQERTEGVEYTVDCFTDKNGNLLLCVPRIRASVLGAHAVAAKIQLNKEIYEIALRINANLKIYGPWNFQLFQTKNGYAVHDINPRIASGIIFSLEAGAAFDKLIVDHLLDSTAEAKNDKSYMQWVQDGAELYGFNVCSYAKK